MTTNEITMKIADAAAAIETCVKANRPVCLWGPPGVGKSEMMEMIAAKLDRQYLDIRAVLYDPVDLRGLPHISKDGKARWAQPGFLPTEKDKPGIIVYEELNRAVTLVQNSLFQLILNWKLGEYELPRTWAQVACCNRESDGGGVHKMPSALMNRFVHIHVEPDIDDWSRWAIANDIESLVVAFLRWKPELLYQFDRNSRAFPTPRSWKFLSDISKEEYSEKTALGLYAGTVGHGAAIEFLAFEKMYRELPNIDAILLSPDKAKVPKEASQCYAIATALGRRAEKDNFERVITYLERMDVEYNIMAIRDAAVRDPQLCSSKEFRDWSLKHKDVVL